MLFVLEINYFGCKGDDGALVTAITINAAIATPAPMRIMVLSWDRDDERIIVTSAFLDAALSDPVERVLDSGCDVVVGTAGCRSLL